MESATEARFPKSTGRMSKPEIELLRRKESIQMSRTRVLNDLRASTNPRYKVILTGALAELDKKLTEFR